jgi:hypothetical protein
MSVETVQDLGPAPGNGFLLEPGTSTKGLLTGGFHSLWLAKQQNLRQQRSCSTVGL